MISFLAGAHPFIVHFAVSLTILSALFECASLFTGKFHVDSTALTLAVAAVPFLLLAVLTGNLAESVLPAALKTSVVQTHKMLANITVWSFTALIFGRVYLGVTKRFTKKLHTLYVVLLLAAATVAFFTAERGGEIYHGQHIERRL